MINRSRVFIIGGCLILALYTLAPHDQIGVESFRIATVIIFYVFWLLVDLCFERRRFTFSGKRWWVILPGTALIVWEGSKLLNIMPAIGGSLAIILIIGYVYFMMKSDSGILKSD